MMRLLGYLVIGIWLLGCIADYEKDPPPYESELVIEAYVNQVNPFLNYAILTKSLEYYNDEFSVSNIGVKGAKVMVFEGREREDGIQWNENPIEFLPVEGLDTTGLQGIYAPPFERFFTAKQGFVYRMEVEYEGVLSTAITSVPVLVPIDSIWTDYLFNEQTDSVQPFMKFSFTDPDGFGNYYMISEWEDSPEEWPFLWGTLQQEAFFDDLFLNGQEFVFSELFPNQYGDTVNVYLFSIDQQAYNYWLSYDNSRNNGGPFSQPIQVNSTFDNARGFFQGMSVDTKRIIIKEP